MASNVWDRLNRFRTSHWGVVLFYGYLVGILVAAFVAAFAIRDNHRLALKANSAATLATRSLCYQKHAALAQLRGTRRFLRDHPDGTADFSRVLIMNAIHNDEIDVAALRDVHCSQTGGPP
jgi:hypothetical protein